MALQRLLHFNLLILTQSLHIYNHNELMLFMKLKNIKSREVIKILQKNGFEIKRQTGTHVILKNNEKMVVVPIHHATIPIGTLKNIEKQSGIKFRDLI